MENFFDFHLHPTVKNQLAPTNSIDNTPWKDINFNNYKSDLSGLERRLLGNFLKTNFDSQSSLNQLVNNNVRIINVALFAPDRKLLDALHKNCVLGKSIENRHLDKVIARDRFLELIDTNTSRFDVILNDLELLKKDSGDSRNVIFIDKNTIIDEENADNLYIVFSVEGLHCLRSNLTEVDEVNIKSDILTNIDILKTKANIISINLSHIDNDNGIFANQPFALDGVGDMVNVINLFPDSFGLTPLGEEITKEIYDRNILIDVKHLSIISRLNFYNFRKNNQINQPILCTHAGFTGCWFNNSNENEKFSDFFLDIALSPNHPKVKIVKPTPYSFHANEITPAFNASSINLFNEDIIEIIKSDGMIGISLDQRILGYNDRNLLAQNDPFLFDLEIFSDAEFTEMRNILHFNNQNNFDLDDWKALSTQEFDNTKLTTNLKDVHLRQFTIHIIHAMKLVHDNLGGIEAVRKLLKKQLCLGSDFDGLISAIEGCLTVEDFSKFKKKFKRDFEECLNLVDSNLLPSDMTIEEVANRFFYENGRDFILNRLSTFNQLL